MPAATDTLYQMGLQEAVVGISHQCGQLPWMANKPRLTRSRIDDAASSAAIDEQVRSLTDAQSGLYEVDVAAVVQLAPDVIITQAQCDVCAVRHADVVEMVQAHPALRRTRLIALNPRRLADVFEDVLRIGEATESCSEAREYVDGLKGRVAHVRNEVGDLAEEQRPRVALVEWIDPLMLAGNWNPELIRLAGGRCAVADTGAASAYHAWRDLVAYDPQVIVVAPCGFDLARSVGEAVGMGSLPDWHRLAAVRDRRVYVVDGDQYFNVPSPRLVESLELMAHWLHGMPAPQHAARHWTRVP